MKKVLFIGACLTLLLGAVFLAGCQGSTTTTLSGFSTQQQGIFVAGQGDVSAKPDIFNLSLGVEARDATVEQAQTKATDAMNKVISSLKNNGIAEKDIQTQNFSINPVYKFDDKTQESVITGYQVTNTVVAKVRNLDKAGDIIDTVALAGGDNTRINSIGFDIEDKSAYTEQAREKAMADALARAQQLAKLAGVTLGKPTFVSEQSQFFPPPIALRADAGFGGAESTPISPGELKVSITVQVTYAILP